LPPNIYAAQSAACSKDVPAILLDTDRAVLFSINGFSITAWTMCAFLHTLRSCHHSWSSSKTNQARTWTRNRPVRVLPMYGLCFLVTQWHIRHRLAEAELAGARNRLGISHVAVSDVRHRRLDRHNATCQHHLRLIGRLSLYSRRPCRIRPDSVVRLKKQVNSKNGVQLLRILLLFLCPHASREI
jgi:hypothetical protein